MAAASCPLWLSCIHSFATAARAVLLVALAGAAGASGLRAAYDAPVSPDASPEAIALHQFLGSLRGKYILSGQQEFPGWPDVIEIGQASDPDFRHILDVTGKMPAVRGFDLLFYTHSAGGRATQRTTQRAIEWWQQGGIVAICVHMFMDIGSPAGNPQFYVPAAAGSSGGTTFDIARAVTPGTPEHTELLAKIDICAAELLVLRDAGVPVIWRPFHECSGGWFWWGAKGAAPFKDAWRLMFDRLTVHHGLNNLLWCYNPTEAAGALAGWYPGDDVVDIISLDIYPPTGTHPTFASTYEEQFEFRSGRKVVGLSENGAIPDPDALFAEGAHWAWFCTWNGAFIRDGIVNPADFLQRVFTHPRVLTRDELAPLMPRAGIAPEILIPPRAATTGAGADLTLAVVARGSAPLAYQWRKDGADIAGATGPALTLTDATPADVGQYSVVVSNAADSVASVPAAVVIEPAPFTPPAIQLANLSTRAGVGADSRMMVAGFVIGGQGAKRVLIRAVGPTLADEPFGVAGTVADPELILTTPQGEVLARNDDWGASADVAALIEAFGNAGAFDLPAGSRDAALIIALPPGGYTALVAGVAGQEGVAIVEVYDLDLGGPATLVNLSTRADVGAGDNVLVAGFVTSGAGSADLLIRAVGPTLGLPAFGVAGALADAHIALTLTNGDPVSANDDWSAAPNFDALVAATGDVGAFALPEGSKDAVLLETVPVGGRTAVVTGPGGASGIALAEIYLAP